MTTSFALLLGCVPVILYLVVLLLLDSFKLVRPGSVLVAIGVGVMVALVCLWLNSGIMAWGTLDRDILSRYLAPAIEETVKAVWMIWLMAKHRIGFAVDAALYGFGIGAGFALAENMYYLWALGDADLALWFVRGLGTAVMHGGATALTGIVMQTLIDRRQSSTVQAAILATLSAGFVHAVYNHFVLSPLVSTVLIVLTMPLVVGFVFRKSETATQRWLGSGMDHDLDIIDQILTDKFENSPVGQYLSSLRDRFPGTVVVDMLGLVRLHSELSLRAKGMLMMRKAGFSPTVDAETSAKLDELEYLEKSIGPTGRIALRPILSTSRKDLWQINMLRADM